MRAILQDSRIDAGQVDGVVVGQVITAGAGMNPTRQAALNRGLLPQDVPAMTVNSACGSAAQAIATVAQEVWSGHAACTTAGGMENMDQGPYLLARAGGSADMIARAEINEDFAAIAIALTQERDLSEDIVNVEGGAIALGHPIGATGAILTTRVLHAMARNGLNRGRVTLCIGGGQGIALLFERDT